MNGSATDSPPKNLLGWSELRGTLHHKWWNCCGLQLQTILKLRFESDHGLLGNWLLPDLTLTVVLTADNPRRMRENRLNPRLLERNLQNSQLCAVVRAELGNASLQSGHPRTCIRLCWCQTGTCTSLLWGTLCTCVGPRLQAHPWSRLWTSLQSCLQLHQTRGGPRMDSKILENLLQMMINRGNLRNRHHQVIQKEDYDQSWSSQE